MTDLRTEVAQQLFDANMDALSYQQIADEIIALINKKVGGLDRSVSLRSCYKHKDCRL